MKMREALSTAAAILENKGIEGSRLDAEVLLMHILKKDRTFLIMEPSYQLSQEENDEFFRTINERASGKPVSYITGEKEFMGLTFKVCEAVLIPRPDTEILVEEGIEILKKKEEKSFLDMCTGSGAIAVSLAYYVSDSKGIGADISPEALAVARNNAVLNEVNERVSFVQGDLFESISEEEKFDLIASNPPYIRKDVINELMTDVKDHEPALALDGGPDGLDFYRRIVPEAARRLKPGGSLLLEIGHDQGQDVSALLHRAAFSNIRILKDLAGHDRVVCGEFHIRREYCVCGKR